MSEQSQRYARATWIVEANSKVQAEGDARTYPRDKLQGTVTDPMTYTVYASQMNSWRHSPKANLVFTQMNQKDEALLTYEEKQELIQMWIDLYYQEVMKRLRERYERESNAASN